MAGPCTHETSCAQRGTFRKHLLERGRTIFFSLIVREAIAEMQKKQEQERKEFVKPVITPSGEDYLETVVLLSQQKPDDTIEIELDLDELDATSAETKATYQEIKNYVLKEFGLKVSNLYISQIKRKCGIEVGENYNLPKTENPKVPQCPKEKEEAIKAALKYFAMI